MGDRLNLLHYQQQQLHQQQLHQQQQQQECHHAHYNQQQQLMTTAYQEQPISLNSNTSMKRGRSGSEESTAATSAASLTYSTTSTQSRSLSISLRLSPPPPPQEYHQQQQQFGSATPKKARSATYEVPRSVKPSILTAMGTLAGGNNFNNNSASQGSLSSNTSVPMRRRLSGGHIDQFIGVHDSTMDGMDIDTNANRHRSMSF
jgi:hypothetical protein